MCPIDKSSGAPRRFVSRTAPRSRRKLRSLTPLGLLTWHERVCVGVKVGIADLIARVLAEQAALRLHGGVPPYPGASGRRSGNQTGLDELPGTRRSAKPERGIWEKLSVYVGIL